ncbi:MAG: hypothetical protein AB7I13_00315 [Vicinamibacterales bacterium]
MLNLGRVAAGSTIRIGFSTAGGDGGRLGFSDGLEAGDVRVYKDGSTTERSSTAGFTVTNTFDSMTGMHLVAIDLSDNTDSGFYAIGSTYLVALYPDSETVDSKAPAAWLAQFTIAPASDSAGDIVVLAPYGVAFTLNFSLRAVDGTGLKVDAAHASGDTKVMKDEGAEANTTNGFTDEGQGYAIALTATEMQAARVTVYVVDQGNKVWVDKVIHIQTYGHPSAQHPQLGLPIADMAGAGTPQAADATSVTLPSGASATDGAYVAVLMAESGKPTRILYGSYVGSTKVFTFDPAPGITYTTGAVVIPMVLPPSPTSTLPAVDVGKWRGTTAAVSSTAGMPGVDVIRVNNTAQSAGDLKALLDAIDDYVDTEVAAIKAKTDNLPSDPADQSLVIAATDALASTLATIASYIDTEIAAIKAVTDALTAAAAAKLASSASGIITGTAATGTLSTTHATSSLTGYSNDQLIGRLMTWLSGPAAGEQTRISDYVATNGELVFAALTAAPQNGNAFVIH